MKSAYRSLLVCALVAGIALVCQCGGGGATQFDDQTLNDNKALIQTSADNAELVFVGTITAVGTAPAFWSGIAMSAQGVTYTVDAVLKGSYTESGIIIYHILVDGSRQAASTPGLNSSIFAVGGKLIVFAAQNADYVDLGEGWEIPDYIDVDENYGTIPYSSQNESVIKSMIANPTAMQVAKSAGFDGSSFEKTLTVGGAEADITSFNNLLDQCKEKSATLSSLVAQIQNSEAFAVTLNIVRNEAGVFVDAFTGRRVDIKDLEDWHEGCDSKTDLCQLFGHILQEYWHAAVTGDGYQPSHASALQLENQIRSDLGKTTTVAGHFGVNNGGTWYMETAYGANTELVKIVDGANPGEVTVQVSPPAAPTNLTADNSQTCQITVSWTDNSSDEYGFDVERKDGAAGTWVLRHPAAENETSWINSKAADPALVPHETYCYRVRAWKADGMGGYVYSGYSNEACTTKE